MRLPTAATRWRLRGPGTSERAGKGLHLPEGASRSREAAPPRPSGQGGVPGGARPSGSPARLAPAAGPESPREGLVQQPCSLARCSLTPPCAPTRWKVSLLDTNSGLTLSFLENLNNSIFSLHNAQPLKSLICPLDASKIFLFKIQYVY